MEYSELKIKLSDLLNAQNYKDVNCCLNCIFCEDVGVDENVYECHNDKNKLYDNKHWYFPTVFNGICNLYKKE